MVEHCLIRCPARPSVFLTPVATASVTATQTATVDVALGGIQGQITSTLPSVCTPGVYLYGGNVTNPEDMNSSAPPTDAHQPLTAVLPVASSVPPYAYQFTALPPGTYTLALTCQTAQDDPTHADPAVTFGPVVNGVIVTADHMSMVNIS